MDSFLPLITFVFSTALTPGPNNIMVTASGANYGYRRTLPHIMGVAIGFPVMIVLIGFGLGFVFEAFPWLHTAMKYIGAAYLLYLAWKIATAKPAGHAEAGSKPFTFIQAVGFQWINPKAWTMGTSALASFTSYEGGNFIWQVLLVAGCYLGAGVIASSTWTLFGTAIGRFLKNPRTLRIFNYLMAALLVLSLGMVFF